MTRLAVGLVLVALAPAARGTDFEIDCFLNRGDSKGSRAAGTLKMVSGPRMIAKSGETTSVLVGGQVPISGQMVPVGREVEVTATAADNGAIRVRAVLKLHMTTGKGPAPQTSTVSEQTVATVQPCGSVRVAIGKDPKDRQWVDVTVRPAK
jgi:hypothetical protein